MFARRQITPTQFEAGRRLQTALDAVGRGAVQAMDPGKVKVDSGKQVSAIPTGRWLHSISSGKAVPSLATQDSH
jgi:hypothetical protein